MRITLYFIAAASAVLLAVSTYQLSEKLSKTSYHGLNHLLGFDSPTDDQGYDLIIGRYNEKIRKNKDDADHHERVQLWLSIIVTALTAGSTLVSSIQASKKEPADNNANRKYLIVCAVLTFLSTITTPISSYFKTEEKDAMDKVTHLMDRKKTFLSDYKSANAETRPGIIKNHKDELDQDFI
ncbi:hypothetical protein [Fluviicola sp.]|uniref:hypothetical protein n=1 Tax=Fluviicola sp. TaxID=1917219 RepID=UPI003D2BA147